MAKIFLDSTTFSNVEPRFLGSGTKNEKLALRPCEIVIFAQLGGWRFLLEALACLYLSKTIQNKNLVRNCVGWVLHLRRFASQH